ncbi:MAG: phosphate ABC transporter permease subunit PstC [Armatimonadetes bacterium]|nr:phosphate ABC transporter permease subunit PstC [Armatimonadota bacterium]
MRRSTQRVWEWIVERTIGLAGVAAVVFVLLIFGFLLRDSIPLFGTVSLRGLFTETRWLPTSEPARFGLIPLILGSLYVTFGALVIAVPLGLACAIYIAEVAPPRWREWLKPAVELLAAVPSVVFGFVGLLMVGPWLADKLNLPMGQFAALGSLLLAFMAIPTIVSVAEDALNSVPRALRDNSLAMGATEWQTISRITVPAARSGVIAACLLGMGRAIGETMTVLMVTGNAAVIPAGLKGFIQPVRTLTATIAAEMGETAYHTPHYYALFMVGLLLFIITLITNVVSDVIIHRAGGVKL